MRVCAWGRGGGGGGSVCALVCVCTCRGVEGGNAREHAIVYARAFTCCVCGARNGRPLKALGALTRRGAINNIITVCIQMYSVLWLLPKTEGFVVISHSTLNPYQVDLVFVRVINNNNKNILYSSQWESIAVVRPRTLKHLPPPPPTQK